MEVRVRAIMEGFWSGLHRSSKHGFSSEFSEYRSYVAGDDPRRIDWKVLARTDRAYVKRFRDETNLRAILIVDRSRSMDFLGAADGQGITKADYASTLASTLAYFLMLQGDAVGLATISDGMDGYVPPTSRRSNLPEIIGRLESRPEARTTDLSAALEDVAAVAKRRSLFIILSDFLCPIENLRSKLGILAAGGHQAVAVRIEDPVERDLSIDAPTHIRDLETDEQIFLSPDRERDDYLRRYGEHVAALERTCSGWGVDCLTAATDRPVELSLHDLVSSRRLAGS